jgi:hypothetical protein
MGQHSQGQPGQVPPWAQQPPPNYWNGQPGAQQQYAPPGIPPRGPYRPPRGSQPWITRHPIASGIIGFFILLAVIGGIANAGKPGNPKKTAAAAAVTSSAAATHKGSAKPSPAHATHHAAAKPSAAPQGDTVTYKVTGSPTDVTYGQAGNMSERNGPGSQTEQLGDPSYVSLEAQLQGGGSATCEILVNGQVISEHTASGGYSIAMCEITQDFITGDWEDTDG